VLTRERQVAAHFVTTWCYTARGTERKSRSIYTGVVSKGE